MNNGADTIHVNPRIIPIQPLSTSQNDAVTFEMLDSAAPGSAALALGRNQSPAQFYRTAEGLQVLPVVVFTDWN